MKHIIIRDSEIEQLFEDKKYIIRKKDNKKYSDEDIVKILLGDKNVG